MPRLLIVTALALAAGQAPGVGEPYTPHESQIAHHGAQLGKHFGTKLSEMGGAMLGGAKKLITALSAAAVPVGPLPDPSHMLKEHQQMVEWWCSQPNHSDTYACRKKVHLEKLKKTPPNSTARQALLKQSPTRACMSSAAADKECQAQSLKEVQTMMRQYCSRFDGASQTALCRTSSQHDLLLRSSLRTMIDGLPGASYLSNTTRQRWAERLHALRGVPGRKARARRRRLFAPAPP